MSDVRTQKKRREKRKGRRRRSRPLLDPSSPELRRFHPSSLARQQPAVPLLVFPGRALLRDAAFALVLPAKPLTPPPPRSPSPASIASRIPSESTKHWLGFVEGWGSSRLWGFWLCGMIRRRRSHSRQKYIHMTTYGWSLVVNHREAAVC